MTPAARVQAAILILDKVIEAARGQGAWRRCDGAWRRGDAGAGAGG